MRLSIYLALIAAVILPQALAPVTRRLAPKAAAFVLAAGGAIAGLVWVGGLALLAVATVGRLSLAGRWGHWSVSVLNAHDPVPLATGLISVVVLALIAVALAGAVRRLSRGLSQVWRLHVASSGHRCDDLTIIDSPTPEAVALPGWRGSIMVTSGMLRALSPAERQVLLAHERSHLRSAHWLFRLVTRFGAALLPTARSLVRRCDLALERWADEAAADVVGDRELVATAVAKAALATTDHQRSVLAPAFSDGAVVERVEALLVPRRESRWGLACLPVGVAAVAMVTIIEASRDLESLFETAKHVWPF